MPGGSLANRASGSADAGTRLGTFRKRLHASFGRRAEALFGLTDDDAVDLSLPPDGQYRSSTGSPQPRQPRVPIPDAAECPSGSLGLHPVATRRWPLRCREASEAR